MLQLLEALSRRLQFAVWRFLALLDECVEDHHALAHHEAIERSADAATSARSKLEQAGSKGATMGQAQVSAVLHEQFKQAGIVGEDVNWPGFDLGEYPRMEVLDLECHTIRLANTLTQRNP